MHVFCGDVILGESGGPFDGVLRNRRGDVQPQVLLGDAQQEEQAHHDRGAARERVSRRHRVRGGT